MATIHDYGDPLEPTSNPSLAEWAVAVAGALDTDKWTPWVPTITGGTVSAADCRYRRTPGGQVDVDMHLTIATITGSFTASLPATPVAAKTYATCGLEDVSTGAAYNAMAQTRATGPIVVVYSIGANGVQTALTPTSPFTWAPGDLIHATFSYRVAPLP